MSHRSSAGGEGWFSSVLSACGHRGNRWILLGGCSSCCLASHRRSSLLAWKLSESRCSGGGAGSFRCGSQATSPCLEGQGLDRAPEWGLCGVRHLLRWRRGHSVWCRGRGRRSGVRCGRVRGHFSWSEPGLSAGSLAHGGGFRALRVPFCPGVRGGSDAGGQNPRAPAGCGKRHWRASSRHPNFAGSEGWWRHPGWEQSRRLGDPSSQILGLGLAEEEGVCLGWIRLC